MTSISAPKKYSNFPFANVMSSGFTFLVADANTGNSFQLTPAVLVDYMKTALLPVQSSDVVTSTIQVIANTNIDQSYNGKVIYCNSNTDVYLTIANTVNNTFQINLVNLSPSAIMHIDYSGFDTVNANSALSMGRMSLMKLANTFVGG